MPPTKSDGLLGGKKKKKGVKKKTKGTGKGVAGSWGRRAVPRLLTSLRGGKRMTQEKRDKHQGINKKGQG